MAVTAKQHLINVLLGTKAFGTDPNVVAAIVLAFQVFIDSQIDQLAVTGPAGEVAPKPPPE